MPGPAPKPASKRRHYAKPKSYGAADPVVVAPGAAAGPKRELGFDNPHPLILSLWNTVQASCESQFYSEADWARLKLELWFADHVMSYSRPSGQAWAQVQHGLNELLISPAVKRRAGIEVKPSKVDEDEVAAVSITAGYRERLKSV